MELATILCLKAFAAIKGYFDASHSGYQENPSSYIYMRSLALHAYIHWLMNWREEHEKIDPIDDSLTRDWGAANLMSKHDYVEKLANATSTTTDEIDSAPRPAYELGFVKFFLADIV